MSSNIRFEPPESELVIIRSTMSILGTVLDVSESLETINAVYTSVKQLISTAQSVKILTHHPEFCASDNLLLMLPNGVFNTACDAKHISA